MRILLIRQDKLGDLLITTPVFQAIKELHPDCHLTVWCQASLLDTLRNNPWLDAYDSVEEKPKGKAVLHLARKMRQGRFDLVVFLRRRGGGHIAASFFAGIPQRVGSITKPSRYLLTKNLGRHGLDEFGHETDFCYEICEAALGQPLRRFPLSAQTDPSDAKQAQATLAKHGVVANYFVVHPCTGGTSNEWYMAAWGRVAQEISTRTGLTPLFSGTRSEAEKVAKALETCPRGVSLAGETSLLSLAVILKNAKVMVAANTGTMHLAATQETPIVMLETTPDVTQRWQKWRPWMTPSLLVGATKTCEGCTATDCHRQGTECKDSIEEAAIVQAALTLLSEDPDRYTQPTQRD